ncbi:MAG: GNAT family N-acetyltransferase [Candidatus Shapirobacteria bacterium]|nr:GNAT family N-acetyltransferase [Candidatus Shapirobacteria bacterium]
MEEINHNFFIQQGILDCQIDQLIDFSNTDPEVIKNTSDPIRFKDLNSFNNWLEKGKIIYTLTDKNHNLLGIIWFSHKNPPIKTNANFTFAIRVYPPARGEGLSLDFTTSAFTDLLKSKESSKIVGFWLEVSNSNQAAIKTYEKFGFQKISKPDNNHKIIMIMEK